MAVTLDHLLMLAGRLDDTRGFDAPRERFRRFLREHVLEVGAARTFIEQCQHALDEQHVRALDDLVVLLGRFAGFDVTFGAPLPGPDAFQYQGAWQSRSRVHVIIEVRSALSASPGVDGLIRTVSELRAMPPATGVRTVGLVVLTPLAANRTRIEQAIAAARPGFPIGIARLGELVSLVDRVSRGQVSHADLVKVLESTLPLDFVVEFVDRLSVTRPPVVSEQPAVATATTVPAPEHEGPSFWMASVARDHATSPEEFLQIVVGRRHVFGVTDRGTVVGTVRDGDWICFFLPGKGVVGHARVAAIADGGTEIRDARRFRQVLRLDELEIHLSLPIALDAETELRLRAAPATANRSAQILVEISQSSFKAMTSPPEAHDPGASAERLSG
jgi:hypothetical protein